MNSSSNTYSQAIKMFHQQQYHKAKSIAQNLLSHHQGNIKYLQLYANCTEQCGNINEASLLYNKLGNIHAEHNHKDEAKYFFAKATTLSPNNIEFKISLIKILISTHQFDQALQQLMNINPHNENQVKTIEHLIIYCYIVKGDLSIAAKLIKDKLAENSNNPWLLFRAFELYIALNQIDNALNYLQLSATFAQQPIDINLLYHIANALYQLAKHQESIEILKVIANTQARNHHIFSKIADNYFKLNDYQSAKLYIEQAIKCYPCADYYAKIGLILFEQNNNHEAMSFFNKLIDYPESLANLSFFAVTLFETLRGTTVLINICKQLVKPILTLPLNEDNIKKLTIAEQKALIEYFFICANRFSWDNLGTIAKWLRGIFHYQSKHKLGSIIPFFISQILFNNPNEQLSLAKVYSENFLNHQNLEYNHQKILTKKLKFKIGYISADLNQHVIGFLLQDLFAKHDKTKFEVHIFYNKDIIDDVTIKIMNNVDYFHNIYKLSDLELAKFIYDKSIDVLIDLSGYTSGHRCRALSYKPAPIQAHWLGQVGSMGAKYIDYQIVTRAISPDDTTNHYTENLVYLPESFIAIDRKLVKCNKTKEDLNLPQDMFIFASYNSPYRIDQHTFDLWLKILNAVPNSVLWMVTNDDEQEPTNLIALQKYAEKFNVAKDRIIRNIATHNLNQDWSVTLADLVLDSTSISAGTSSILALWAKTPVLTLSGNLAQQNTTKSTLHALDLAKEGICQTADEYVQKAIDYALNPSLYNKYKKKLVNNRLNSTLFNQDKFIKQLEDAYVAMWCHYHNDLSNNIIKVS